MALKTPENGFYYHYKHDPHGARYNYMYEVTGVGENTEARENLFVLYRPLSPDSPAYQKGKCFYVRPLEMFMEEVEKGGKRISRFTKITDPDLIIELENIRDQMYA